MYRSPKPPPSPALNSPPLTLTSTTTPRHRTIVYGFQSPPIENLATLPLLAGWFKKVRRYSLPFGFSFDPSVCRGSMVRTITRQPSPSIELLHSQIAWTAKAWAITSPIIDLVVCACSESTISWFRPGVVRVRGSCR
jgi:hypothetical protein